MSDATAAFPSSHTELVPCDKCSSLEKRTISVVVPVYRSEHTLKELYRRLVNVLEPISNRLEIIFVDDAGGDSSWEVISELARRDSRVLGLQHSRNFGQHNALLTGVRAARNDIIVTLDDDLQNPPEEIPILLALLEEGYDVAYGTPVEEQHGLLRDSASRVTKLALQGAMGADTARKTSAFRAFRTLLRNAFSEYHSPYVSLDVLLTWGTTRFGSAVVKHDPRRVGVSNYTLSKLMVHAFNMITGFSVLPLQVASMVGLIFTLFGIGLLLYVLIIYFIFGSTVSGFPFLASVISLFSGAQLFALGIIGEYIARIHVRSMGRPFGVVRQRTGE